MPTYLRRFLLQALVLLLAVLVAMALRQPDKVLYPQFWAEDASIFYLEAEQFGLTSLLHPYNGYWHLFPRSVALIGTGLPVLYLPVFYAVAALLVSTLALVAVWRAGLARTWPAQVALVLTVLLVPYSGELWLTLTNTQWFGALLLVGLLAGPSPSSTVGRAAQSVGALAVGCSGPFAILLWPCVALRAWWQRDGWSTWLLILLTSCAVLTLVALVQHPRAGGLETLPERLVGLWRAAPRHTLAATAAVASAVLVSLGFYRGLTRRDLPLVVCSGAALLIAAATILTVPSVQLSERYLFLPWIFGTWTAVALGDRGVRIAWLAVAAALAISLATFTLPPMQRHDWPRDARCLETHRACDMVVNPGWGVGLPGRGPLDP